MHGWQRLLGSLIVGCLLTYGFVDGTPTAARSGPEAVAVAAHSGAGHQDPRRYRVSDEPQLQIGSASDGESALYRVTAAVRLRDGRIVVANSGTRELKFFDSGGVHLDVDRPARRRTGRLRASGP